MKIKAPSKHLRDYVKYFWSLDYNHVSQASQQIIPTGLADIFFHFENIPQNGREETTHVFLSKPTLKPYTINMEGHVQFVAVALYPHTPMLIFDFPLGNYAQNAIPLDISENKTWSVLHYKLYEAKDFDKQVELIEDYLTKRIFENLKELNFTRLTNAIKNITLSAGKISTNDLSKEVNLSSRQFAEIFRQNIGLTAGSMAKVIRMQKAIHYIQLGIRDLADVYVLCNYYDRSHFIKDCKSLTGLTPKELTKEADLCSDYFAVI